MKTMLRRCGWLMALVLISGCAQRYVVVTPLGERPAGQPSMIVGSIDDALPADTRIEDRPRPEALEKLRKILLDDLTMLDRKGGDGSSSWGGITRSDKPSHKNAMFSSVALDSTGASNESLQLTGKILSYKHGSRAARYIIGFGAGKGLMVVQLRLRRAGQSDDLFVGNFKGEITGGFFGGSNDEPLHIVSRDFSKFLKDKWK